MLGSAARPLPPPLPDGVARCYDKSTKKWRKITRATDRDPVTTAALGAAALVAGVLTVLAPQALAQDVRLRSVGPCQSSQRELCTQFSSDEPPPDVLQQISLRAPGPGSALVTLNASGSRFNFDDVSAVTDFVTHIVADEGATHRTPTARARSAWRR
jgi:hypothetical protein